VNGRHHSSIAKDARSTAASPRYNGPAYRTMILPRPAPCGQSGKLRQVASG